MELDGPRHGAAPGASQSLVVLLHGLGADGHDLISLAPLLGQRLPGAAFVSPHAPFPCDMAPFGRQWFSLQDRNPAALLGGVRLAAPVLDAFLDAELERHGLDDDRLALVGFSQGTMMALFVALRRARPCAGVVGYSGALIAGEVLPEEIASRPPVLLVHGDADDIVPVRALPAAVAVLQANSVPVESETRPGLGHGIDDRGLELGLEFLARHLG
jgi:phospholipase/carboxylesterase